MIHSCLSSVQVVVDQSESFSKQCCCCCLVLVCRVSRENVPSVTARTPSPDSRSQLVGMSGACGSVVAPEIASRFCYVAGEKGGAPTFSIHPV